jgi:glutaredoxin
MARAPEVIMYSRPDCHLCELAAQMLEECNVAWYEVDIETDLDLIRKHGARVPVLYRADIDRELVWPFSSAAVSAFVELEI